MAQVLFIIIFGDTHLDPFINSACGKELKEVPHKHCELGGYWDYLASETVRFYLDQEPEEVNSCQAGQVALQKAGNNPLPRISFSNDGTERQVRLVIFCGEVCAFQSAALKRPFLAYAASASPSS